MRDVSAKGSSLRTASAEATLCLSPATIALIREGRAPKGDPLAVARIAGIQAAKNTPLMLAYCHTVPLDHVDVNFEMGDDWIRVTTETKAIYKTGVEMEALTAASIAALNLYDLLKPVDESMEIIGVRLLSKTGGKSQVQDEATFTAAIIVVSDGVAAGARDDLSGARLCELLSQQGGVVAPLVVVPDDVEAIRAAVGKSLNHPTPHPPPRSVPLPNPPPASGGGDGMSSSRVPSGVPESPPTLAGGGLGRGCEPAHGAPDLLVLTGGTGLGPRDSTPQAVIPLLDSRHEGLEHRIHAYGQERLPHAMLGRPFAGRIGRTVVIGLPGSPGAVADAMAALFPYVKHAFHIAGGGGHDD